MLRQNIKETRGWTLFTFDCKEPPSNHLSKLIATSCKSTRTF